VFENGCLFLKSPLVVLVQLLLDFILHFLDSADDSEHALRLDE